MPPAKLSRAAKVEILGSVLHVLEHMIAERPEVRKMMPMRYRRLIHAAQSSCWVHANELSKADIKLIREFFDENDPKRKTRKK